MSFFLAHRHRQPRGPARIRRSHPLACGLVHAWNLGSGPRDLIGSWHGSMVANGAYDGMPSHERSISPLVGAKFSTRVTDHITLNGPLTYPTNTFTQLSIVNFVSSANQDVLGLCGAAYNDGGYPLLHQNGTFYSSVGTALNELVNVVAAAPNTTTTYVVTRTPAVTPSLYINQTKYAFSGALSNTTLSAKRIGAADATSGLVGRIALLLLYDYEMPEDRIRALIENPWQIFRPVRRQILVGAIAPTFNVAWNSAANTVISSGARVQ